MEEKRVKFVCERTGWNYEKGDGLAVISLSPEGFCHQDASRPKETFRYRIYSASFEDVCANVAGIARDFDASEYAFYLQREYIEKHLEIVVPPVLSISKFAEYVEQKLDALNVSLSANLALDSFERKIVKIAESEGFDVFIRHKKMSDKIQFWSGEKHLGSRVERKSGEDGYEDLPEMERAEALKESLLSDICETEMYSEVRNETSRKEWNDVTERGRKVVRKISKEFGI